MKHMNNHYVQSKIFGKKRMNLQLFAAASGGDSDEGGTDDSSSEASKPPEKSKESDNSSKSSAKYTDEDVDKMFDRKFAELMKKHQKEMDEARRLAEMNAQEKAEYENNKLKEQVQELMKKEARSEMSKAARAMLSEKGINVNDNLLGALVSDDADKTKKSVENFITLFQEAVNKAVKDALKGEPPKTGTTSGLTKEQIMKVTNRAERQRLIKENMNLFQ